MRSTNPNATRFLLKRNLFIGVIVFLVVFSVFPFWGLSHIPNMKADIMENALDKPEMLTNLVSSSVMTSPLNLEMMVIVFGGLGFLCAMMLSRHLFSRRQGMLHAALPDKRETDFLRRMIAYAVLCLCPIVVNFLLYLLVVAMNGLLSYVAWETLLPRFGLLLLINLYGFAMGMLASALTGTYWAALLAGAVLIIGMEGMACIWNYFAGCYLHTLVNQSFNEMLLSNSPAFSLYKGFYRPAEFVWYPGVLAILASLGLSFGLYRVRKTETAERTLAFAWLHIAMGFILPVLGGSILGMIVYMSFTTEFSLIAGMIVGAAFTFWVCRMVFNQRFCGILKQWYLPAAAAVVLVLCIAVLHTDAIGYDHFLPEREKLTAISYRPQNYHSDEYITLTSDDALDAAYEWCTLMRDEVDSYENGIGASIRGSSSVMVTYQFGDQKVYRLYPNWRVRTAAQPVLQRIIESDDYRQSLIREFCLDNGTVQDLYLNSHSDALRNNELYEKFGVFPDYMNLNAMDDGPTMERWLSALKEDILTRTFVEKQQDEIMTLQIHAEDPKTGYTTYQSFSVYPGDDHFLKEVFGDQAEAVVAYATGGYAASEDIKALKVTYTVNLEELGGSDIDEREAVKSVKLASSPEEAVEWVKSAQSTSSARYYFMPDYEKTSFSKLYIYRLSEVERYQASYGYTMPEEPAQFYYQKEIPSTTVMDFAEK